MSNLPRRLLRQNVSGVAVLCCDVRDDRRLDCVVNTEWPEDGGFGHSALRVARYYRLTPQITRCAYGPAGLESADRTELARGGPR